MQPSCRECGSERISRSGAFCMDCGHAADGLPVEQKKTALINKHDVRNNVIQRLFSAVRHAER